MCPSPIKTDPVIELTKSAYRVPPRHSAEEEYVADLKKEFLTPSFILFYLLSSPVSGLTPLTVFLSLRCSFSKTAHGQEQVSHTLKY